MARRQRSTAARSRGTKGAGPGGGLAAGYAGWAAAAAAAGFAGGGAASALQQLYMPWWGRGRSRVSADAGDYLPSSDPPSSPAPDLPSCLPLLPSLPVSSFLSPPSAPLPVPWRRPEEIHAVGGPQVQPQAPVHQVLPGEDSRERPMATRSM